MTTKTRVVGLDIEKIEAELRPLQMDLMALALQGKQLHWNVDGRQFMSVHAQLDTIVSDARTWTDELAERLVAIGGRADGQPSDIGRESSLEEVAKGRIPDSEAIRLITDRVGQVASRARSSCENLATTDLGSQDICLDILRGLEKHHWMLASQMQ
jgi:starvation-inducible DNA-binding protein